MYGIQGTGYGCHGYCLETSRGVCLTTTRMAGNDFQHFDLSGLQFDVRFKEVASPKEIYILHFLAAPNVTQVMVYA